MRLSMDAFMLSPCTERGSARWRRDRLLQQTGDRPVRFRLPRGRVLGHVAQQIEISALDQLFVLDPELIHEVTCLTNSLFGRLVVHQSDFELEKMAETFDAVQVNAGTSNQEESAVFSDTA